MIETSQPTPGLLEVLKDFFETREGSGVVEEIGDSDLIDAGWVDSLDLVELATLVSEATGKAVDLTKEDDFNAMRSIQGILQFASPR